MGCENSKSDSNDEDEIQEHEDEFNENRVDSIKSTWPILTRDRMQTGSNLFRHIFLVEPRIKALFKRDRSMTDEEVLHSIEFKHHVERFMHSMDQVVENIDKDRDNVEHMLLILGAKHATYDGFKEDYFSVYANCMIDTWESVIGEEFIKEVRESWELLVAYVISRETRQILHLIIKQDSSKEYDSSS
ncbi:NGB-like protein [Mya arenaria]|uniref:NGB-like protein n=1 Tax=Mya arenaria TaxID=6604 RepID=A0ABY7EA59_MYAAR|nr:NGB-like protein [Mya arenaria]